ncbi:hypothetical protein D3C81_990310 [compost metagenome]
MGTGELRRIHSRVSWMCLPVDRSMMVSAPQRIDHTIFSTSSASDEVTAELPRLPLILTRKLRPIAIGSSSVWLMLAGMIARPEAISWRTNSGVMSSGRSGRPAPSALPGCWRSSALYSGLSYSACRFSDSRSATYSISGVMMPRRA